MNPENTQKMGIKFQVELVAAVLFRFWGSIYLLDAVFYAHHWLVYHRNDIERGYKVMSTATKIYELDIWFHIGFGLLMMSSAVPLARLICKGLQDRLSKTLEINTP